MQILWIVTVGIMELPLFLGKFHQLNCFGCVNFHFLFIHPIFIHPIQLILIIWLMIIYFIVVIMYKWHWLLTTTIKLIIIYQIININIVLCTVHSWLLLSCAACVNSPGLQTTAGPHRFLSQQGNRPAWLPEDNPFWWDLKNAFQSAPKTRSGSKKNNPATFTFSRNILL